MPRARRRYANSESEGEDDDDDDDDDDDVQPNDSSKNAKNNSTVAAVADISMADTSNVTNQSTLSARSLPEAEVLDDADGDTLRILVSTDNHLGYCERDPVRGLDSFAAMEEVLYLAKHHYHADCVLLAGDLFHDNKPSRRTLYKTLELFRRYCLGHDPIKIQVISAGNDALQNGDNGSTNTAGNGNAAPVVNYEDGHYAIDLPVFSIHGNHDDPTREGGGELLAALDLLSVTNLVNYFGRQEEVQAVRVTPILLRKGSTKVALYGLGSMRDERLNRMWNSNHVKFLRPSDEDGNEDEDTSSNWFNLFTLHQNRDAGRGTKNCIHESMIPEWMDFVVWGHEHESRVEPQESVVGTFRISQPGSSVATSLTLGETATKQIGILDICGINFRMKSVPLTQVRSFMLDDVCLAEHSRSLDPDDPKVDMQISTVLEEKTRVLIHNAREKRIETLELAHKAGNPLAEKILMHTSTAATDESVADMSMDNNMDVSTVTSGLKSMLPDLPLSTQLLQPNKVLLRLRVDHTGFSAQSNQRFGAKFIQEIANPTDILLFHRKRVTSAGAYDMGTKGTKSKNNNANGSAVDEHGQPIEPDELDELDIEDLVADNLVKSDRKLELFDEKRIAESLQDYVEKQQAQAINDKLTELLTKKQRKLIERGQAEAEEEEDEEMGEGDNDGDGSTNQRSKSSKRKRARGDDDDDDDDDDDAPTSTVRGASRKGRKAAALVDIEDDSDEEVEPEPPKKRGRTTKAAASTTARTARTTTTKAKTTAASATASRSRARKNAPIAMDSDFDDDMEDVESVDPNGKTPKTKTTRKTATTAGRRKPKASIKDSEDSDSDIEVNVAPTQSKPVSRATASSTRGRRATAKKSVSYSVDDSEEDGDDGNFQQDDDIIEVDSSEEEETPKPKAKAKTSARSKRPAPRSQSQSATSQSQLSFTSTASSRAKPKRAPPKRVYRDNDSDDS